MQSAIIPPKGAIPQAFVPGAPAPANTSQPTTPFSAASVPNGNGPAHPNGLGMANPTPSTGPNGPDPSPSLANAPHPQLAPSYPSLNYPSQGYNANQGWMYAAPQYYNPQPYQPRHYNNGYGAPNHRYNNGADAYGVFAPQGYYPIPQLGGPGPGTMQNGYGGYGQDYPPYMRTSPYQTAPQYPAQSMDQSPRPQNTQVPPGPDGPNGSSAQTIQDTTPYQQHPPQPSIPPPADYNPNHFHQPPQSQSAYPVFPPNHPYAHGGGIGFVPGPQHSGMNGFDSAAAAAAPQHHPLPSAPVPAPAPATKKLNPAAAGFTFIPAAQRAKEQAKEQVKEQTEPKESSAESTPVFASLAQPARPAAQTNGSSCTEKKAFAPVMVDGEKLKAVVQKSESKPDESANAPPAPGPTAPPTTSTGLSQPTTPAKQASSTLTFTGPPVSGYTAPEPVSTKDEGIIKLASAAPESSSGVVFSTSLASTIPSSYKTEKVQSSGPTASAKGRKQPARRTSVLALGVDEPLVPKVESKGLSFGELGELTPLPAVKPAPKPVPSPSTLEPSPVIQSIPAAKPKLSSWAGLFSTPSSSKAASIAPSGPFSPSSEAGPSRLPTSPSAEPATPRSGINTTAPPSTGVSASGQRPLFNYAAAASAGAPLSPQEELAQLLSQGLKGKGKETLTVPRGLINTGNMCFANTVLQVLVYCPPFAELFEELGKRLKADFARKTPLLEAMIIFLREFAAPAGHVASGTSTPRSEGKARDTAASAFIPENVYDAMKENKRFDSMRRGYQEDAEEYLGFFLDTLHEELLALISRTQLPKSSVKPAPGTESEERAIQRPVSPNGEDEGNDGWLEVGKKQKTNVVRNTETRESAITKLFGGTIRSVLHTPGSKDSVTLEPYQPLQLDIQGPEVESITDALKHLAAPEVVPGVWSASRNANVDATKQVYIESFPQVLMLHLKRFVYDGREQSVVKRSKPVAYGTELVIPQEIISPGRRTASAVKYRLFGVVYHHGPSATGGHYTVAVSRQDGAGWIHFDDETYSTVPTEQVVVSAQEAASENEKGASGRSLLVGGRERCAYLLFYQRARQ